MMRRKHVPLRSCIACRGKHPKRDLIRVVSTPDGTLEIDAKGKRQGRGAYMCRDRQCCEIALQPGRLSKALKRPITEAETEALKANISSLIVERSVESEIAPPSGPGTKR